MINLNRRRSLGKYMKLKIVAVDRTLIADSPSQTSDLHFIYEYAERQAQLPRYGVERLQNAVLQRGRRSKSNAWLLGVSCSALFGFIDIKMGERLSSRD